MTKLLQEESIWPCPKCNEIIESAFDRCWNCGTDKAGNENAEFKSVAEFERSPVDEDGDRKARPWQFSLIGLFVCMLVLSFILSTFHKSGAFFAAFVMYGIIIIAIFASIAGIVNIIDNLPDDRGPKY